MRRILALIGLLLLALGVGGRGIAFATSAGVQCPTARVQTIRVPVLSKCGCVLGHVERAPKPGEKGFKQCRCAEGRAAHEGTGPTTAVGPAMPALLAPAFALRLPLLPRVAPSFAPALLLAGASVPPPARPPAPR